MARPTVARWTQGTSFTNGGPLTAVFTPANPKDFTGSTSATLPYLIYATPTRTTLTKQPPIPRSRACRWC